MLFPQLGQSQSPEQNNPSTPAGHGGCPVTDWVSGRALEIPSRGGLGARPGTGNPWPGTRPDTRNPRPAVRARIPGRAPAELPGRGPVTGAQKNTGHR